jgi:FdhE protein
MTEPLLARSKGGPGEIIPLRLPVPAWIFERRAARFRILASGHAVGDYLAILAALAEAQHLACQEVSISLDGYALSPTVPLCAPEWRRDEAWRQALALIVSEMGRAPLPGPARAALARLGASEPAELEAFADAILTGSFGRIDLAAAPFVGAALQVYWTVLAAGLSSEGVEQSEHGCPVCGSPPVAGVVLGDDKLRYLACSLCATAWHLTRVTCASCRATGGISYFSIQGDPGAVKAEACLQCQTYLKLFYLEQNPQAEPFADDIATLSLDLLMSEQGYARGGVNLFLLSGLDS